MAQLLQADFVRRHLGGTSGDERGLGLGRAAPQEFVAVIGLLTAATYIHDDKLFCRHWDRRSIHDDDFLLNRVPRLIKLLAVTGIGVNVWLGFRSGDRKLILV